MKRSFSILLLSLVFLSSCAARETSALQVGPAVFRVETADTAEERQLGLMHRKSLDEDAGMLFVFERDKRVSFWMKDTPLALSIAFIDSRGQIREIRDLEPLSTKTVVSRHSVRYALEVNRGAFGRAGVVVGDRVILD